MGSDEGVWKHPDGSEIGTRTYDRNFIDSVNFINANTNPNAVLEISHITSGENAPIYLPDTGTRTAAHLNDASEFRFRLVGDGNRLRLFSSGEQGTFLVAYAEFNPDWFPFEFEDGVYLDTSATSEFILHVPDGNAVDNVIAVTRFGPRTQLDWRFTELFDTAVPYGAAPRARLSSSDQQAILNANESSLTGAVTICLWCKIEEIGSDDIIFVQREDTNNNGFELGINSSMRPYMKHKVSGQTARTATGSTLVNLDEWFFLAGVVSSSNVRVFLNGSQSASVTNSNKSQPATADLVIGNSNSKCRILFDEMAAYRRELDNETIGNFYASRTGERIFAGYVVGPDVSIDKNIRSGSIDAAGYGDRLSRRKVYPDPDNLVLVAPSKRQIGDIATDLIRFYAGDEGITTHGIRQVGEIEREVFPVESIMECLDTLSSRHAVDAGDNRMAQLFGVDDWKDTFFRNRSTVYKYPHRIEDSLLRKMSYARDITEFGNVWYVTGGPDGIGQRQEERFVGDGVTRAFPLKYPAREISEVYFDGQLEAHSGDGALWNFDPENHSFYVEPKANLPR